MGDDREVTDCESCKLGKSKHKRQNKAPSLNQATRPGERVHMDTCGPFERGPRGERYAVIIVDEYTGFILVHVAPTKSAGAAASALRVAARYISAKGHRIMTIRSDQGTEFIGAEFRQAATEYGINQEFSARYQPSQNGRAERGWGRLLMVVRCMLTHAGFEKLGSLWGEAISHAAHVTNITRMKQDRPSPQEKINDSEEGRLVEGAGLMVFGAKVSVHGPSIPGVWKAKHKGERSGVVGYYMGQSKISPHVGRYFVPDCDGKKKFVETTHVTVIDGLTNERRKKLDDDMDGLRGNWGTIEIMDLIDFGMAENHEVDERCEGSVLEIYDAEEGGAPPNIDERDRSMYVAWLEPAEGMRMARYFGEVHGWCHGYVKLQWRDADGGIHWNIEYDDEDREGLTDREARMVMRAYYAAMIETYRLQARDDAADEAKCTTEGELDNLEVGGVGSLLPGGHRIRRLMNQKDMGHGVDEILDRLDRGENFDELTGQLPGNFFDMLEETTDQEGAPWRCYEEDGTSRFIDPSRACPEEMARSMRDTRVTGKCRRSMACAQGGSETQDDYEDPKIGSLGNFATCGGLPDMKHEVEELEMIKVAIDKATVKTGPMSHGRSYDSEKSESIEDETMAREFVYRCVLKGSKQAVYIDPDQPPFRLAMLPSYPDHKEWLAACAHELEQQVEMGAFVVVDKSSIPRGQLVLRTGWRMLQKRCPLGKKKTKRARAYLAGYSMRHGTHYAETTSPTVRPQTLRMLLALACQYNLALRGFDISLAFLSAYIDYFVLFKMYEKASEIIPKVVKEEGMTAQAIKAIYGCKQSSRRFWLMLIQCFRKLGFTPSRGDACLWTRAIGPDGKIIKNYDVALGYRKGACELGEGTGEVDGVRWVAIATFVDDLCIASSSNKAIDEVFKELQRTFRMKDEGKLESFLGCRIERSQDGKIKISQPSKCLKAATAAGVIHEKQTKRWGAVPMLALKSPLTKPVGKREDMSDEDKEFVKQLDYRAFVGQVLHIYCFTRPDIGFSVTQLASHCNDPRREHVEAAKVLGRYLLATADMGITYEPVEDRTIHVWVDADYADCPDTRRSITGFVVMMGRGAVSWSARKQTSVALSTLEAEAVAARAVLCEVIALKWDLEVLDPVVGKSKWTVHEDNQSVIAVVTVPDGGKYEARKHIAVRIMWLREVMQTGIVEMIFTKSAEQVADVMTKALAEREFTGHRCSMMNQDPPEGKGDDLDG